MAAAGPGDSEPPTCTNKRMVDKALKQLDKLHELCTNPRLCLKNSPPYLPNLVSDTKKLLAQVWEPYRGSGAAGSQEPRQDEAMRYLRVQVRNLLDKTARAVLLFKEGREKIFEETSSYRTNLTKLSLLFSHILWELKALFPGGRFQGDTYKLTKTEAEEFWRQSFGNRCIVRWNSVKERLSGVHAFEEGMESTALKSTIDLTCDDYISVFEFDIFTSLFQPWRSLMRNWHQLAVAHPGYMAFLTYDQVVAHLQHYQHKPGSYIFRLSSTRMGQWAIGHVTTTGNIIQTIPQHIPLYQALIKGFKEGCYLYPDGRDVNPDLTSLCEPIPRGKIKVTEEQYELYCDIGSTFQLCKICTERDKDTRILPCGHLLCQPCLTGWQQRSVGHTCPYCRCDIRGAEAVLIEPYLPGSSQWEEEGEEDAEDDGHEDTDFIVKEVSPLKRSSWDNQVPTSSHSGPLLPPKIRDAPSSINAPSPSSQSQTSDTEMLDKQPLSTSQAHSGNEARRHRQHAKSSEFLPEASSSQRVVNGGEAYGLDPPVQLNRVEGKRRRRKGGQASEETNAAWERRQEQCRPDRKGTAAIQDNLK